MFGEKGVILRSALAKNIKVTLALWPHEESPNAHKILCKPTVSRLNQKGAFKTNQPYKSWLSVREVYALIGALERGLVLMEEYSEGTLDLKDILAEDEDARMFTRTKSVMYPTIDGMFDMTEALALEEETDDD